MDKRIFIIHPSHIIRQGIHAMIRNRIDWDILEFCDYSEIANYRTISNSVILFLADERLANADPPIALKPFFNSNFVKTLLLSFSDNFHLGHSTENSYIHINFTKEQLLGILDEQFGTINKSAKKTSTETSILTERERDILKLVALGKSNKEMAHQLSISIHTVITHRKNITEKLNIKSISGLTVYAILNRLLDAENIDLESLI